MIKIYQYPDPKNVGDNLALPILKHFLKDVKLVDQDYEGKLVSVGSVMSKVRPNDKVWGTGIIKQGIIRAPKGTKFLAVRGKMTREMLRGTTIPEVYGDPGLLLPLMYAPQVEKKYDIGFIPHYVDKPKFKIPERLGLESIADKKTTIIDVALPWKEFVDRVLECEMIVSSSLHGIVIAEAYGIPAMWAVYSGKVIGNGFKFRDYLTGTGREKQNPGLFPPIPDLPGIQKKLLDALYSHYRM